VNKIALTILILTNAFLVRSQSLKKVETYYDPYAKTRIHEAYTTLPTPPYPIQGVYKEWDQSGVLMTEVNFQNGKKHGPYKVFINAGMASIYGKDNVGKVYTVTNYSNDKLNGLDQMYDYTQGKPQIILQKTWLNGKQIKEEAWYEDGKPKTLIAENGLNNQWHSSGKKASEVVMKNGLEEGRMNEWYKNGQLAFSANYKGGKIIGDAILYYEDGSKKQVINYDPTTFIDLKTTAYFPDGKVKFERTFADQQYKVAVYDSIHGSKKLLQNWVTDPRKNDGSLLLHGVSSEYETDGSIIEEINYELGNAIGEVKTLDKSGKVVLSGRFEYGKRVGEWLYYLKVDGSKTNKLSEAIKSRKIDYGPRGSSTYQYVDYYLSGEKFEEGTLRGEWPGTNIQTLKKYFKNGQLMESGFFGYMTNGNGSWKNGEWKRFYENGQLKTKGNFNGGNETGVWEFYDESGKLVETKQF
jgi:antitoxin component YwqK of YwqJK toxin-antitoxin module